MQDGQGLSDTLGPDSELPLRCREGCDFSFAERQKSSQDTLPLELSHLNGPNFFGVSPLLITHEARRRW